jgi:S1-C subfamily serine protease
VASAISGREPGDEVDVVVTRDGDRRTVSIELGERPARTP